MKADPIMELKCALSSVNRAIGAIQEAQRGLEIHYNDLCRQAEWLKGEIASGGVKHAPL